MSFISITRVLDLFRGKAITIPPMDGALRPNNALDEAREIGRIFAPDNLIAADGHVIFSSNQRLNKLESTGAISIVASFESEITALAARPGGGFAIAFDDGRIHLLDEAFNTSTTIKAVGPGKLTCPTALLFSNADTLLVTQGSANTRPSQWARDLLEKGESGSLWRITLSSGVHVPVAERLSWPSGIATGSGNAIVISESWKHRLVEIRENQRRTLVDKLPGYPGRLSPASGGGHLLALFAPRNRLIEFVLGEDDYRREMVAGVDPRFWIAPALSSGTDFREPLQCGGVKTMGVHKPWSPSRSYGLLVRLDEKFQPAASYHSRANGTRHGITSAIELDGKVLTTSRGGNVVIELASGRNQ